MNRRIIIAVGAMLLLSSHGHAAGGGIDVGQAFSDVVAPYLNAFANALILAAVGWVATRFHQKTGMDIDSGMREAITKALERRAGALIASGSVKLQGTTVKVDSPLLAVAAQAVMNELPAELKRFGWTPDKVAGKIVATIPTLAAGAAMIAQAHAPQKPVTGP